MIAKIGKGRNIVGAVSYNQLKVEKNNGKVLLAHKIPDPAYGNLTVAQISRAFEPYLIANNKTERPVRHISLNPDPSDKVSDDRFMQMANQYMKEMGYAQQPYIVYKHTDIERTHIHIVTTCVKIDGSKIPDSYDHHRSMQACRNLETVFGLKSANEKVQKHKTPYFKPVEYSKGDLKSQMASVIRYLPKYYSFSNLGTYNALLSLFNITAEQISGQANGTPKKGLVYFALDPKGEKTGKPFKSSLFGKAAGMDHLQTHFENSTIHMSGNLSKTILKNSIEAAQHMAKDENDFKRQLLEQGINTVVRSNKEGRIYGITFIDHESRSVWNGSQLGKNLSANVFNHWWNNGGKPEIKTNENTAPTTNTTEDLIAKTIVGFIPHEDLNKFDMDGLFSLVPPANGEDYEEEQFAKQIKKKKKKGSRL